VTPTTLDEQLGAELDGLREARTYKHLRPLITAELPLERYEEAFALLESGEACKIVLRPNGATP
jgi:hypothetical protein